MIQFIIKRLFSTVFILWGVVTIIFLLSHLVPVDPVTMMLGERYDQAVYEQLRHSYGFDQPLWQQYINYMWQLLHGDFGKSYHYIERPVADILRSGVPISLQLGGLAILLELIIGIPSGVLSAIKQNTWIDRMNMGVMMILYSVPNFVLIPICMLVFGVQLRWLPVAGWGSAPHMVMPVAVYTALGTAFYARLTRSTMLEVMREDYIRTARSKGLPERMVIYGHALRNALIPLVSALSPSLAFIVTGAFIIESMFNIPGIGYIAIQASQMNDYPVVAALTLILAVAVALMNMIADILYTVIDPRIRL
ncbi:MAG: ABC transporter permease [Chloroflexi bacterium]|nr:ABC transporter permease [Chloroflexota bacterium]MCL5075264.1 ABC transporter permease [Chloroflexota bacterium]